MYQPERRKCARYAVNLGTVLAPVDGIGRVCSGTIRNISCGGVCLCAHSEIEPETIIFVLLKTVVKARVVRVALESPGRWRLNCAFVKEMDCSEMEGLLPGYSWLSDPLAGLIGNDRAVQRFSRHRDVRVLERYDDNRRDLGGEVAKQVVASVPSENLSL